MVKDEDEERVIHLLYTGDDYNGHYNALDLMIKRKAPMSKNKLPENLAKTCFKPTHKLTINSRTFQFNHF